MIHSFRLFFVLLMCLSISPMVWAQQVDQDYMKQMPNIELLSDAELKEQTVFHQETPEDYEDLAYSIRYPKGWEKYSGTVDEKFTLKSKIFGELVRFYSPPRLTGHRSQLAVRALQLDYKLSSEQWLLQHLLSSGYTVEGFKVHSENRAEAIFVKVDRGLSFLVRALVEMSGSRLMLVEYSLPIEYWDKEKVMQAQTVASFELLNKEEGDTVEELKSYAFLDVANLHYPSSWYLQSFPLRSIDRMEAQLLNMFSVNDGGFAKVDGKILIDLVSAYDTENLESEIKAYDEKLKMQELVRGEARDIEEIYNFNDTFEFARVHAYKLDEEHGDIKEHEIWTALLSAEDYFYFVTLLTPSEDNNFYIWSRNTQTYREVLEMLTPLQDSVAAR